MTEQYEDDQTPQDREHGWCGLCHGLGVDLNDHSQPCPRCSGTKQSAVHETEGEVLAKEAAMEKDSMDSPFDGYGRPFSDDPLGMSQYYNHDNPANNVGPYSGPSSYSINTVAPYAPKHEDEENPGQNVGPYNPPREQAGEEAINPGSPAKKAYKSWKEAQWFDGTAASIYQRAIEAEQLLRIAKSERDHTLTDELSEQVDVLNKTAAEYDDSALHEVLDNVPGGTVALEYDDLVDGGLVDVTSFLSVGAHQIAKEAAEYDWAKFRTEGARVWVSKKIADNPGLIKHEVMCREAAVDYAKDKTMVLMDPVTRAQIIDEFVTASERYRREAAARLLEDEESAMRREREIEAARMDRVADHLADSLDNFLPGQYTDLGADYDEEGYLDIGEDDGSLLYEAARDTIESSKREWGRFTTEGAREWFFDKVSESPMRKHEDITYRAAATYARTEAGSVPDTAFREEIVRAFTESVEFLRTAHSQREAARSEEDPEADLDEFFGEEQLW